MDVVWLSRLQFAMATYFHFLFVPLTLGLSILVAIMESRFVATRDEEYRDMAKYWGKLFLINFAIGIVTGITLEFQFGTNWSRYSEYVGDIFGSLLAIEASVAFFLESTFIAVWIFGWKRLSPKMHAASIWIVALASSLSAIWILVANAWMQYPVGYVIRNGRAELENFFEVITSKFALIEIAHTLFGAYVLSAFFVMGISAYHLLKKQHISFFTRSFRIALVFGFIFAGLEIFTGHLSGGIVAEVQPPKLAAMESLWETTSDAPIWLFLWPDEANERNLVEFLPIPNALSLLASHTDPHAVVPGLKEFAPGDRPPVLLTFLAFRIMAGLGVLFFLQTLLGLWFRKDLLQRRWYLRMMLYSIPLPYIACQTGWTVTEVGRQPWIVYGLMRTSDAASPIASSQVLVSLVALTVLYTLLGFVDFYLLAKYAKKGPAVVVTEEPDHA